MIFLCKNTLFPKNRASMHIFSENPSKFTAFGGCHGTKAAYRCFFALQMLIFSLPKLQIQENGGTVFSPPGLQNSGEREGAPHPPQMTSPFALHMQGIATGMGKPNAQRTRNSGNSRSTYQGSRYQISSKKHRYYRRTNLTNNDRDRPNRRPKFRLDHLQQAGIQLLLPP